MKTWLALLLSAQSISAQIIYDNIQTPVGQYLDWNIESNLGAFEVANQIHTDLPQSAGTIIFEYFASNLVGSDNAATIKIYAETITQDPGQLLYQSSPMLISNTGLQGSRIGIPQLNLALPSDFFVSLTFQGLTAGENAGPTLYFPPATGQATPDFWTLENDGWVLNSVASGAPVNFGIEVLAVPEISSGWFMAALCFFLAITIGKPKE